MLMSTIISGLLSVSAPQPEGAAAFAEALDLDLDLSEMSECPQAALDLLTSAEPEETVANGPARTFCFTTPAGRLESVAAAIEDELLRKGFEPGLSEGGSEVYHKGESLVQVAGVPVPPDMAPDGLMVFIAVR